MAHILIDDQVWAATLSGYKTDRTCANQSGPGRAWCHPDTGLPIAFELNGVVLTAIPEVVRVRKVMAALKLRKKLQAYVGQ